MKPIEKYDIVRYNNSWYRVTTVFKKTVNLKSMLGSAKLIGVNKDDVVEDREGWEKHWHESESYKCQ